MYKRRKSINTCTTYMCIELTNNAMGMPHTSIGCFIV